MQWAPKCYVIHEWWPSADKMRQAVKRSNLTMEDLSTRHPAIFVVICPKAHTWSCKLNFGHELDRSQFEAEISGKILRRP